MGNLDCNIITNCVFIFPEQCTPLFQNLAEVQRQPPTTCSLLLDGIQTLHCVLMVAVATFSACPPCSHHRPAPRCLPRRVVDAAVRAGDPQALASVYLHRRRGSAREHCRRRGYARKH